VDAHVNIEKAWQPTRGKGITIAVIDDGVDIDHPEFAGRVVHPFDATLNSHDPRPKDPDDNHGTSCAGVACATGLNGGASGVAPEAFLLPIRLRSGLGSMAEANAFAWAADHGADVISCSWGPTDGEWWNPADPVHNRTTALPDSTRLAIEYALTKGRGGKGCTILFAAGNGNEDTRNDGYSSYPGVIAVAACNDTGKRSVYSDYGQSVWVCFPSGDYAWKPFQHPAPISEGLRTTDRRKTEGYTPDDYINNFGGTSGACPGVAGIVALMLAANPGLGPAQVKDLLRRSCRRIDEKGGEYDSEGHSIWYGHGRVDAGLAVENALAATSKASGAPAIGGAAVFSGVGEKPLQPAGALTNAGQAGARLLRFRLTITPVTKGLILQYKANVPGVGIVESKAAGDWVGALQPRQRVVGFAVELSGAQAAQFDVAYTARLKGVAQAVAGRNGAWCGTDKKTGKTVEEISVLLLKKQA
jgi:subtilisin family serine protease